ncbi:MAG: xanthine phosphoribosyltransferase [Clostridia bacterium]|jgi:xanthine phosphoribosyltransferase|nr:xanthine phosphoribosyltransferase [Clostridiaceae bacterium]
MEELKKRILEDARIYDGSVLKVDSFLNHQLDIRLLDAMGREFKKRFADTHVTKILTVEASGISLACMTAVYFNVPVIFAKKSSSLTMDEDTYNSRAYSYTRSVDYTMKVSKRYIKAEDSILIIDDFLANGEAAMGLIEIAEQAGAQVVGIGAAIEKGFQKGGKMLREKGYRVESLVIVKSMENGNILFEE